MNTHRTHLRLAAVLVATLLCGSAAAASIAADRAVGYGREATGGGSGAICKVADLASLRACLAGTAPANAVVERGPLTIEVEKPPVDVGSNKTLDGRGQLQIVFTERGLRLHDSSNVIVRGVRFRSTLRNTLPTDNCAQPTDPHQVSGCGVAISMDGDTRNVWIDHDDFTQCGDKCITGWGRQTTAGPAVAPDLVTISNSRFTHSYYAILFGVAVHTSTSQYPTHPIRLTVYGNLFEDVLRRSPRLGAGFLHVFNNDIRHFGGENSCEGGEFGFGPSVVEGGQMLLENNVIEAWPSPQGCKNAVDVDVGKQVDGFAFSRGNLLRNGATARGADRVFAPDYPYTLLDARQVEAQVAANAGADH